MLRVECESHVGVGVALRVALRVALVCWSPVTETAAVHLSAWIRGNDRTADRCGISFCVLQCSKFERFESDWGVNFKTAESSSMVAAIYSSKFVRIKWPLTATRIVLVI